MKRTLFSHLFIYILSGSILMISLFSFLTFQLTENRFEDYLSDRFINERETVIETIETAYDGESQWDREILSGAIQNAMNSHMFVRIVDADGNEIISQSSPMGQHMRGMQMIEVLPGEDWFEEEVDLFSGENNIGTAFITYPGFQDYTSEEEEFIEDLILLIALMGLLTVVIAGVMAYLISRRLSRPIAATSERTQQIAQGRDIGEAETKDEKISELFQLQQSVNVLAARLAEQKRIRNQMVSDLAHEVRTPLTTLQGNVEAMLDGVWEVTPERLNSLNRQVIRLAHLVQLIDQLDDTENTNKQLNLETFDIKELLSNISISFEPQVNEKQVTLNLKAQSEMIEADRNKLEQVITNLLANAVKFTPEDGEISLISKRIKNEIIIMIQDNGKGIPEDKLDYIFERFYQVEPSRNSKLQGQGIGLAVVKSIIDAHQGDIRVESDEGRGTTFTVVLPESQKI
ncbi:ATP-binding protein [Alkalibacterium putridalgicola]|uniref:sensor histidine kinase n=1 Tax=Alkalibacterium putridalgicola TaxID=426703 RepID=UPI0034CF1AD6